MRPVVRVANDRIHESRTGRIDVIEQRLALLDEPGSDPLDIRETLRRLKDTNQIHHTPQDFAMALVRVSLQA